MWEREEGEGYGGDGSEEEDTTDDDGEGGFHAVVSFLAAG